MTLAKIAMTATLLVGLGCAALADELANKDEAVAMVNKAIGFIKSDGPDKAYAEFTNKDPKFIDRDLYVVVFKGGTVLAHGANAKMVGKDVTEMQDVDGKFYVKERLALAASHENFWQDYKFTNPVTKKIEPKQMYCQTFNGTMICSGIYKR